MVDWDNLPAEVSRVSDCRGYRQRVDYHAALKNVPIRKRVCWVKYNAKRDNVECEIIAINYYLGSEANNIIGGLYKLPDLLDRQFVDEKDEKKELAEKTLIIHIEGLTAGPVKG